MTLRLIFLGSPGVGKGTQASRLCAEKEIAHISTGDMFRDAGKEGSALGTIAKTFIDAGNLVPDDIVVGLVQERILKPDCVKGFLLDGFPRTLVQADQLKKMLQDSNAFISAVFYFKADIEQLIKRISGRRVCVSCGATYNINLGYQEGQSCVKDNGQVEQRKDDLPDAVRVRLAVYEEKTKPLVDFYKNEGKLIEIDAQGNPDAIYGVIDSHLKDLS